MSMAIHLCVPLNDFICFHVFPNKYVVSKQKKLSLGSGNVQIQMIMEWYSITLFWFGKMLSDNDWKSLFSKKLHVRSGKLYFQ